MLKKLLEKWNENKDLLKSELAIRIDLNSCNYKDLVKLTFEIIFNTGCECYEETLNTERITEIDDGNYQGTLLFLIPFDTYQPSEYEYLMTYVNYGSCSGCDTLQAIRGWSDGKLNATQVNQFMDLCKDIICNTIKPYNSGW